MNHITSARVMTRDGYTPADVAAIIAARHDQSERQRMLASVARIEARLELERALKRGPVAMATPTPIIRQPGAMATRNPGRIHPAPLQEDCLLCGALRVMLVIATTLAVAWMVV